MARWSNGDAHASARRIAVELLRRLPVAELRGRARSAAEVELRTASDLVPVARFVPVMVLAEALGFASPREAARLQRIVTAAIAPEDGSSPADDDVVHASLDRLLRASGGRTFEAAANGVALLHQCQDTTAGLAALAALRSVLRPDASASELVAGVLRDEPPVVSTVRVAADGDPVTVPLADHPFGAGAHACPGGVLAVALAEGVVEALLATGRRPMSTDVEFERRAHLRIPRSIALSSE